MHSREVVNMIYSIWCETCQDWKSNFSMDPSNLWVLCADCNEGLIKAGEEYDRTN